MTLDGWSKITKEVMVAKPWAWIPFITFVIVSSYFFLNLIIAVGCEAVWKAQVPMASQNVMLKAARTEDVVRLERKIDALTSLLAKMVANQQLIQEQSRISERISENIVFSHERVSGRTID
jgi:hypothetical protein